MNEQSHIRDIAHGRRLAGRVGRSIRVGAGVSVREVARELGVAPSTVSRWENGHRTPRGPLAADYGTLLDSLMGQR
jgi:transcriptional regulator with XRE-family HTH domain